MGIFGQVIWIDKAIELYKDDILNLETLMKKGDNGCEYGMNITDDIYFKYTLRCFKKKGYSIHFFDSVLNIYEDYEGEIDKLHIEKLIYIEGNLHQSIEIEITKHHIAFRVVSDNFQWGTKMQFLLEEFLEKRKYNNETFDNIISLKNKISNDRLRKIKKSLKIFSKKVLKTIR